MSRLRPIVVEILEGQDAVLVSQLRHTVPDASPSAGEDGFLVEQADFSGYSIIVERLGFGDLGLLELLNLTPVSDVIVTTDKLPASLVTSDGLWTRGGDTPGYNARVRVRKADLLPTPMLGAVHYGVTLRLTGGSTYGDIYEQWHVIVHPNYGVSPL